MRNYQLYLRRLGRLERTLGAQEPQSYAPDLLISLPWYEQGGGNTAALAALVQRVTQEAERRRVSSYILIAHQRPDGSWLPEVPWNTPAQREQVAACQRQSQEEAHQRGYSRQGTWHPGAPPEGEE